MTETPLVMDLLTEAECALREVWRLATALDLATLAALDPKEAQIALQSRQRALDAARADGLQALETLTTFATRSGDVVHLRDEDVAAGFGSKPLERPFHLQPGRCWPNLPEDSE